MPLSQDMATSARYALVFILFGLDVVSFYVGMFVHTPHYTGAWDLVTPVVTAILAIALVFFNWKKVRGSAGQVFGLVSGNIAISFFLGWIWPFLY